MRKLLAAVAALSLAAAPVAAQPPQGADSPSQQQDDDDSGGGITGESWAYFVLPALIVLILLIAVTRGEGEDPISP